MERLVANVAAQYLRNEVVQLGIMGRRTIANEDIAICTEEVCNATDVRTASPKSEFDSRVANACDCVLNFGLLLQSPVEEVANGVVIAD